MNVKAAMSNGGGGGNPLVDTLEIIFALSPYLCLCFMICVIADTQDCWRTGLVFVVVGRFYGDGYYGGVCIPGHPGSHGLFLHTHAPRTRTHAYTYWT